MGNPDPSLSDRVECLSTAIKDEHIETWLNLHVQADRALAQWELLFLRRQIDGHPERVQDLAEVVRSSIVDRHEAMAALAEDIAEYLSAGSQTGGLLERIRIFKRARLNGLLGELDEMLAAYQGTEAKSDLALQGGSEPLALETGESSAWAIMMGELSVVRKGVGHVAGAAGNLGTKIKGRLPTRED